MSDSAATFHRARRAAGLLRGGLLGGLAWSAPALLAGCVPAGSAADPPAAGTATRADFPDDALLAIRSVVLRRAEFEDLVSDVAVLLPEEAERSHRRRALKTTLLPRMAAAAAFPAERERAAEDADRRLAELRADPELAARVPLETGLWRDLDLEYWGAGRRSLDQPLPSAWIGPLESYGQFAVLRVEGAEPGLFESDLVLEVRIQRFPYLPGDFDHQALLDSYGDATLTVLDEPTGDLVSGYYLERLGRVEHPQ